MTASAPTPRPGRRPSRAARGTEAASGLEEAPPGLCQLRARAAPTPSLSDGKALPFPVHGVGRRGQLHAAQKGHPVRWSEHVRRKRAVRAGLSSRADVVICSRKSWLRGSSGHGASVWVVLSLTHDPLCPRPRSVCETRKTTLGLGDPIGWWKGPVAELRLPLQEGTGLRAGRACRPADSDPVSCWSWHGRRCRVAPQGMGLRVCLPGRAHSVLHTPGCGLRAMWHLTYYVQGSTLRNVVKPCGHSDWATYALHGAAQSSAWQTPPTAAPCARQFSSFSGL